MTWLSFIYIVGINEVRLLGRCGNDPEARGPNEETAVATFNLATNALTRGESGWYKKSVRNLLQQVK